MALGNLTRIAEVEQFDISVISMLEESSSKNLVESVGLPGEGFEVVDLSLQLISVNLPDGLLEEKSGVEITFKVKSTAFDFELEASCEVGAIESYGDGGAFCQFNILEIDKDIWGDVVSAVEVRQTAAQDLLKMLRGY